MAELRGPVQASERIQTLDIVRGFALLGILIMNMPGFSTSFFAEADGSHLWAGVLDQRAEQIRDMLFSGKFNSMFSLLVRHRLHDSAGPHARARSGAWRQPLRAAAARSAGVRRWCTAWCFWTGDVLHIYVILGFGLLLMRGISNRAVVALIIALICYPAIAGTLRLLVMSPERVAMLVKDAQAWEASNNLAYGHGTFLDAAREHTRETIHVYTNPWELWGTLGFWVQMATTMLIGFLIGRNGWVYRIPELMPVVRRLQWSALALGVVCSLTFGIVSQYTRAPGPSALKILVAMAYVLSRLGMMSFYVLTIVRLAQIPGVATAVPANRDDRTDAADQLPDADADLHDVVLRLGIRAVGKSGASPAAGDGLCHLHRHSGAVVHDLVAPFRIRTAGIRLASRDVSPAGDGGRDRAGCLSPFRLKAEATRLSESHS